MPGRAGRRAVPLLAAAAAVAVLGAAAVVVLRAPVADADTVVRAGSDATLTLPGGATRPVVAGEDVPAGALVTAGPGGAVLVTAGREVHLYPTAQLTVRDGARQALLAGAVVVDATGAPGLRLELPAAAVDTARGALVKVEAGPLSRIGVLRAQGSDPAAGVRAEGRPARTDVPALHQVTVARGSLPGAVTPLALTGDGYELELARDLVLADRTLNEIGRGLGGAGVQGAVVLASLQTAAPPPASPAPDGERALGYLVATAVPGDPAQRVERVRALRDAGGSWGVVAALVGSSVDAVGARLSGLVAPSAAALAVAQISGTAGLTGAGPAAAPAAGPSQTGSEPAGSPARPSDGQPDAGSTGSPAPVTAQGPPAPAPPPPSGGGPPPGGAPPGATPPGAAPPGAAPPVAPGPGPVPPAPDPVAETVEAVLDAVDRLTPAAEPALPLLP